MSTATVKLRWLLLANLLINAGAAFMWPLTTIYLHNDLGESLTTAGLVLLIMSLLMIAGNYIGGQLFDRWRPYETALLSTSLSLVALIGLIFWHDWPFFAIFLIIVGFGDGINMTILNAYATQDVTHERRYIFNLLYMALNLGVVIGTLTVGYLYAAGISYVFAVAGLCYLLLLVIIAITFRVPVTQKVATKNTPPVHLTKQARHMLLALCGLTFFVYASYALWESVVSVHLTSLHIPFHYYSLLWTFNGLLIVFGQPVVTHFGARFALPKVVLLGISLFAVSFFCLIYARTYTGFVIAMLVLTVGEMLGNPLLPVWVDTLASAEQKGRLQGDLNMALSLGRAFGPLIGGVLVDHFSYGLLFTLAGMSILIVLAIVFIVWRRQNRVV
ncbi:MDR family MFS transporter [Loigolactobacillus jiayinensis]|uniref:MDR family MFS transporter n=1 Tax=Loigolactobacillus jiayinensis TaxID=2486016 RepID=A0ABW1RER1_9LACO|nr:MFS transporter [Loigolactobacillus jiayinensis]